MRMTCDLVGTEERRLSVVKVNKVDMVGEDNKRCLNGRESSKSTCQGGWFSKKLRNGKGQHALSNEQLCHFKYQSASRVSWVEPLGKVNALALVQ